ncbi:MAG: hypothetical protein NC936_01985, partial [Candidatus Omnitrophica bacterium]|nr:hypothetical protein [Candidatus Omnitrophota bacterium]
MKRFKFFVIMIFLLSLGKTASAGKDCVSPTAKAIKDYALSLYKKGEYADAQYEFMKCLMVEPECGICNEYYEKLSTMPKEKALTPQEALARYEKPPVAVLASQ